MRDILGSTSDLKCSCFIMTSQKISLKNGFTSKKYRIFSRCLLENVQSIKTPDIKEILETFDIPVWHPHALKFLRNHSLTFGTFVNTRNIRDKNSKSSLHFCLKKIPIFYDTYLRSLKLASSTVMKFIRLFDTKNMNCGDKV